MNSLRIRSGEKKKQWGFTLVEATMAIGIFSISFLSLVPLLVVGLKMARVARVDRVSAQVAQTLIEKAKQGTLISGTVYLDLQGTALNSPESAAYAAQSTSQTLAGNAALEQVTLRVTPVGAPDRARTYAVVIQAPSAVAP